MEQKIADNIRYYRKQLHLTQEKLAETMDVTIGAVSKWENGSTIPDITTLMNLANLFHISMDVLVGYELSSTDVDALCEKITHLQMLHNFKDAEKEVKNTLIRYPHHFKALYTSANMYSYKALENNTENDARKAISLYRSCLQCFSQNTSNAISEYSIKLSIANLYRKIDPNKSYEILSNMNYEDSNTCRIIGNALHDIGKNEKALEYYSLSLLEHLAEQGNTVYDISKSVIEIGNKEHIKSAINLIDTELTLIESDRKDNTLSTLDKMKVSLLMVQAICYACLENTIKMKEITEKAYLLALHLNQETVSFNALSSIRFIFAKKDNIPIFDTFGNDAFIGIEKQLEHMLHKAKYWYELKIDDSF